jgi:RNA polymerase sigma-70 factor (ECF subfamily)
VNDLAFERFVEQQQEPLRRFLLNLCAGNRALADDLAQDAFLKAYVSLPSFKGRSKLSTWLFRIAYNCFYDHVEAGSRRRTESIENYAYRLREEDSACNETDKTLYLALEKLNAKEREMVLLFYMEEKPLKDISVITGLPVNTVKSHLRRAKAHLKTHLKQLEYEKG